MIGERVIQNGFTAGSQAQHIDSVIRVTPMTADAIAQAAREPKSRVRSHCEYWVEKGLFYGRTADGRYYRLETRPQPGLP
jgi:hypothetical protein